MSRPNPVPESAFQPLEFDKGIPETRVEFIETEHISGARVKIPCLVESSFMNRLIGVHSAEAMEQMGGGLQSDLAGVIKAGIEQSPNFMSEVGMVAMKAGKKLIYIPVNPNATEEVLGNVQDFGVKVEDEKGGRSFSATFNELLGVQAASFTEGQEHDRKREILHSGLMQNIEMYEQLLNPKVMDNLSARLVEMLEVGGDIEPMTTEFTLDLTLRLLFGERSHLIATSAEESREALMEIIHYMDDVFTLAPIKDLLPGYLSFAAGKKEKELVGKNGPIDERRTKVLNFANERAIEAMDIAQDLYREYTYDLSELSETEARRRLNQLRRDAGATYGATVAFAVSEIIRNPNIIDRNNYTDQANLAISDVQTNLINTIAAGYHTAENYMRNFIHLLSLEPKFLGMINSEIEMNGGQMPGWVELASGKGFNMTRALVNSTLDLESPVPMAERIVKKDTYINGVKVKKGTNMLVALTLGGQVRRGFIYGGQEMSLSMAADGSETIRKLLNGEEIDDIKLSDIVANPAFGTELAEESKKIQSYEQYGRNIGRKCLGPVFLSYMALNVALRLGRSLKSIQTQNSRIQNSSTRGYKSDVRAQRRNV